MENTQEQNTPEQWFQMLKEPYRSEAIANIDKEYTFFKDYPESLKDALENSFNFFDHDQAKWITIFNSIRNGETTYLETETLKPEPTELRPEDLVSGKVYTAKNNTFNWVFRFTHKTEGKIHHNKALNKNTSWKSELGFILDNYKFYYATPEEKKLLLGEEEPTDWKAKYNELKAKFDQLEPKGEKVYFYFNIDMEKIEIAKSLDEAKINSEECHPIYEAVCIGKKKSVLVNETT